MVVYVMEEEGHCIKFCIKFSVNGVFCATVSPVPSVDEIHKHQPLKFNFVGCQNQLGILKL